MRILVAATVAAVGLSSPALANGGDAGKCFDKGALSYVDCPGGRNWTGFYIGAHLGYAATSFDGGYEENSAPGLTGGFDVDASNLDVSGLAYGGQAGYNYQFPSNLVIGIELDVSALNGDDETRSQNNAAFIQAEQKLAASARLRLGYAMDRLLPYVTGGAGLLSYEVTVFDVGTQEFDETAFGAVAGGGLEFMITDNILLRAEGLYYFLDDDNTLTTPPLTFLGPNFIQPVTVDGFWTARGGISYKF